MAPFRVSLDIYRGPLDLLLYLVRKHELPIQDLPIAPIAVQFEHYLDVLTLIDVDMAGDFLETASTLAEMKSREVLPRVEEVEEAVEDPKQDLVRRLLDYKDYKDAAVILEERGAQWQERFPRMERDAPDRRDAADEPIRELEIWDLVSAFSRIIRENRAVASASIVYDETPIQVHMRRIHDRLLAEGKVAFSDLFRSGMHKSTLVGMFLAMMELVRHHGAKAEQDELFAEIWLFPGDNPDPLAEALVDEYAPGPWEAERSLPSR